MFPAHFSYPYLSWLIIFVFIPLALLWTFNFKYLKNYSRVFIVVATFSFLWGFGFDLVGSPLLHVWSYQNTLGIWLFGLPIEEYIILFTFPQGVAVILLLLRKKIYG
ncbi:MAG: lycopene cyclase domain-containing protein [Patescibacteria group bacterium]